MIDLDEDVLVWLDLQVGMRANGCCSRGDVVRELVRQAKLTEELE